MGFLQAIWALGDLGGGEGLEPYLKFPLEKEGRVIRVYLDVPDPEAEVLDVRGVARVDVAHFQHEPEMKLKYLYRDRVGSASTWGFTPIHKLGKPKAGRDKNREYLLGKKGDWRRDKDSHFFKIRNKLLLEYEATGTLTTGSADRIMAGLEKKIEEVLDDLDPKQSHIVIFGAAKGGKFLYPGEIPAFVAYFRRKLGESLQGRGRNKGEGLVCAICGKASGNLTGLKKVFKFSTDDKVNFAPGLEKERAEATFPICQSCLEKMSGGREHTERKLANASILPGMRLWAIPEAVGEARTPIFTTFLKDIEANLEDDRLQSPGEKREERFFTQLARQGDTGLAFHFVCWERNNAQELVHLMVEDVPPERLAFLEARWSETVRSLFDWDNDLRSLDSAIRSLYVTLSRFAGKSEADRQVFRDFALKVISRMLQGEKLPVAAYKKIINARTGKLIFESDSWSSVKESILFAHAWAEFMIRVNDRGEDNEA
ncbi:TM1802 family CRISPR-associated protein [Neomoorella carbonis]|uniref:TM1802 family CRISPR-associated protein n=1 Tax=Neomoorella carbonis TaxID=3062783 RepID=UPI00324D2AE0